MDDRVGRIFTHQKYGEYEVMEYKDSNSVSIKFKTTGNIVVRTWDNIKNKEVKDPKFPSVYGVGWGCGIPTHSKGRKKKSYAAWSGMLERCYNIPCQEKNPTYVGCSVCPEWHSFEVFEKWFDLHYIEGYEIDKDIKLTGNKVYSPDTCIFVSKVDNLMHSLRGRMYEVSLLSPDGVEILVGNQSRFCRENDLTSGAINRLVNGLQKTHKGWKFIRRLD